MQNCLLTFNIFLKLWDIINAVELQQGIPDKHIWRLSSSGQYTAQSAYEAQFQGVSVLSHMHAFGKLGHLPNVDSLCGWLPTIDVGLQIGWLGEVSRILLDARFATKKKRTFSTSSLGVSSLGSSGTPSCIMQASQSSPHSHLIQP